MGDHGRELNSAPYGHPGRPLPASAPLRPCSAGELAPTPLTSGREVRCCCVHPCWGRRPRSARAGGKRCPRGARRPPPPVVVSTSACWKPAHPLESARPSPRPAARPQATETGSQRADLHTDRTMEHCRFSLPFLPRTQRQRSPGFAMT